MRAKPQPVTMYLGTSDALVSKIKQAGLKPGDRLSRQRWHGLKAAEKIVADAGGTPAVVVIVFDKAPVGTQAQDDQGSFEYERGMYRFESVLKLMKFAII